MEFDDLATLVRGRRTHMLVDRERVIPPDVIEQLCELATWAPCHKHTWPWKFASVTGDARGRLGEAFVADMVAIDFGDEAKREKTRTKYFRAPNVLVVSCASHPKPSLHDENRDTVAAAIQNLLLGASALGLASFWATPPVMDGPTALSLCGFAPDDRIIGVVSLGYPTGTVETPQRPTPEVHHLT